MLFCPIYLILLQRHSLGFNTLLTRFTVLTFKHQVVKHFTSNPHTGKAATSPLRKGIIKKKKSKHSNPQEPNQAEAGAVVAKETERGEGERERE